MVRARRVLIRAVAAAALVVAADAGPAVASSALVPSAVQGVSTCPLLRPAPTGTLDVTTKAVRYYGGFAPDSTVVLCAYDPAKVLDVTLATPNGVIGLPGGIAPTAAANGSHHYVLIGVGPTGRTVALTQEVVGSVTADPVAPEAAATPTSTTSATTAATTAVPSGIDVVVVITGTSAPGNGGGPGGGGAPGDGSGSGVLARTGGLLGLLAGRLGLGLLGAGLLIVFVTRRRGERQGSDLRALR